MTTNNKPRSIQQITKKVAKKEMTFDSYLQRQSGQWTKIQKSKLIDTILREYPIPPVYAVSPKAGEESVIDGCQRITTICEYIAGEFKLSKGLKPIPCNGTIEFIDGKKFGELPEVLKDRILNTDLTIVILSDCKDDELIEVFDRLNGGKPLSTPQKNKVYMGASLANLISNASNSPVLKRTMTATQQKLDINQGVVVEALMLLLADEYPVSGFNKANIQQFLSEYAPNFRVGDLDRLGEVIEILDEVIPTDCKTIKKIMLPPIIKALEPIRNEPEKVKRFKGKLETFLLNPSAHSEYMTYATHHTSNKENIEGRVAFFEKMAGA